MPIANKSRVVALRLTPPQAELLKECAESEGMRLSGWLREIALSRAGELLAGGGPFVSRPAYLHGRQMQGAA